MHRHWAQLLAIVLGLVLGAGLGWLYIQDQAPALVSPRAADAAWVRELNARLRPHELQDLIGPLQTNPPWQLAPDGRDAAAASPAVAAAQPKPERWLLVGRVNRPQGPGLILFQPESGQSKSFGLQEKLPDGRRLLTIENDAFVLQAAKGRKRERIEFSAGLDLTATPALTPASDPRP